MQENRHRTATKIPVAIETAGTASATLFERATFSPPSTAVQQVRGRLAAEDATAPDPGVTRRQFLGKAATSLALFEALSGRRNVKADCNSVGKTLADCKDMQSYLFEVKKALVRAVLAARSSVTGLVLDRISNEPNTQTKEWPEIASVAATGFYLALAPLAVQDHLIAEDRAFKDVRETLDTLVKLQNTPVSHLGWPAHFINAHTGERIPRSEFGSVDAVIAALGAEIAGRFFGGKVEELAHQFSSALDTESLLSFIGTRNPLPMLSHGFEFAAGQLQPITCYWGDEANEGFLVLLFGLGANPNLRPLNIWSSWPREKSWELGDLKFYRQRPLFQGFYVTDFFDLQGWEDQTGQDLWSEFSIETEMHQRFCEGLGYPHGLFAFSAGDSPRCDTAEALRDGFQYKVYSPRYYEDVVLPLSILATYPYAPKRVGPVVEALRRLGYDQGRYGVYASVDVRTGQTVPGLCIIDAASTAMALEIADRNRIHEIGNEVAIIKEGRQAAGFTKKRVA